MKFLVVVLVLYISFFVFLFFGEEKGLKNISASTVVQIDRSLRLRGDATLKVACEKATLDDKKRTVTIEGLVSIAGSTNRNEWVVEKMEIANEKLIIYIPSDANYEIRIGSQFHFLAKTSK